MTEYSHPAARRRVTAVIRAMTILQDENGCVTAPLTVIAAAAAYSERTMRVAMNEARQAGVIETWDRRVHQQQPGGRHAWWRLTSVHRLCHPTYSAGMRPEPAETAGRFNALGPRHEEQRLEGQNRAAEIAGSGGVILPEYTTDPRGRVLMTKREVKPITKEEQAFPGGHVPDQVRRRRSRPEGGRSNPSPTPPPPPAESQAPVAGRQDPPRQWKSKGERMEERLREIDDIFGQ